nr:MAG TPA: hypothetical protein [Caudoviricetes sp.]
MEELFTFVFRFEKIFSKKTIELLTFLSNLEETTANDELKVLIDDFRQKHIDLDKSLNKLSDYMESWGKESDQRAERSREELSKRIKQKR